MRCQKKSNSNRNRNRNSNKPNPFRILNIQNERITAIKYTNADSRRKWA